MHLLCSTVDKTQGFVHQETKQKTNKNLYKLYCSPYPLPSRSLLFSGPHASLQSLSYTPE